MFNFSYGNPSDIMLAFIGLLTVACMSERDGVLLHGIVRVWPLLREP